jgi:hypothetical protein
MPKRTLILLASFLLTAGTGFSQSFMHAVGATVHLMNSNVVSDGYSGSTSVAMTTINYFPRYTLIENDNSSVSVGAPVGIGIGFHSDTYTGTSEFFWGYDLPAVVDYNIGLNSTPDNNSSFGGYFGAGFGYSHTNWNIDGYSTTANSYGPIVRAGFRFLIPNKDKGMSIGLSYKIGLETEKYRTYSIGFLYDL